MTTNIATIIEENELAEGSEGFIATPYNSIHAKARDLLPVFASSTTPVSFLVLQKHNMKKEKEILYLLDKFSTLIVVAETGSGKTTQIPQYLVEGGYCLNGKSIGVTQPRRIATISVCHRVAEEMNVEIGQEVGYSVRFNSKFCEKTWIKFITDGTLIKEIYDDPLLQNYSVIMLDDVHDRNINTDIIFGLIKKIQEKRTDLKILISSATAQAEELRHFFQNTALNLNTKLLQITGRQYPVEIFYLETPSKNYLKTAIHTVMEIHQTKPDGDILVFLTSQEEIELFIELTQQFKIMGRSAMMFLPLYASLQIEEQLKVFEPTSRGQRKCVVSTNVAESSITIDNIVYVIDCCLVKIKIHNADTGIDRLVKTVISKSSGNQRAGRAGRVKNGECYRLCTKNDFMNLSENSLPEISKINLTEAILTLKSLGIQNLNQIQLITYPPRDNVASALETLFSLKILDEKLELTTDYGKKIIDLPIEPKLGVVLLNSCKEEFGCSKDILTLAALLSVNSLYYPSASSGHLLKCKKKIGAKEGDHLTLINTYKWLSAIKNSKDRSKICKENSINEKSFEAAIKLREQLENNLKKMGFNPGLDDDEAEALLRCIGTGYFGNIAQRQIDGSYKSARSGDIMHLHPQSILNITYPRWVIYHETMLGVKVYMRNVSEFDPMWAIELAPHFYEDKRKKIHENQYQKEIKKDVKYDELFEKKEESVQDYLKKRVKKINDQKIQKALENNQRKNFKVSDDFDQQHSSQQKYTTLINVIELT